MLLNYDTDMKHFFTKGMTTIAITSESIVIVMILVVIIASIFCVSITPPTAIAQNSNSIRIESDHFSPSRLAITIGSTVTWQNADTQPHKVTSDDRIFDSRNIQPHESFSYTFNDPGVFAYHCTCDPTLRGEISVG
jgi:plastocyanin